MPVIHQFVPRTQTSVIIRQLQSVLDFGPVVKPLGITVKKEEGKVVETSGDMM